MFLLLSQTWLANVPLWDIIDSNYCLVESWGSGRYSVSLDWTLFNLLQSSLNHRDELLAGWNPALHWVLYVIFLEQGHSNGHVIVFCCMWIWLLVVGSLSHLGSTNNNKKWNETNQDTIILFFLFLFWVATSLNKFILNEPKSRWDYFLWSLIVVWFKKKKLEISTKSNINQKYLFRYFLMDRIRSHPLLFWPLYHQKLALPVSYWIWGL